jgi:hypothetical protein
MILALAVVAACLFAAQPASAHHGCSGHARGGKITLSPDRKTMRWTKGGATQSAPLP